MEAENIFNTAFTGTKQFTQHNVATANATGFGAAADDYMERGIDLNEQLIRNKPATFFLRVNGNSMIDAGISDGDIAIVDRSIKPINNKIVIAVINGDMLIRRLEIGINKIQLIAAAPKLTAIEVKEYTELNIWGVVTYIIHKT